MFEKHYNYMLFFNFGRCTIFIDYIVRFFFSFLNSCGCSKAKSKTPPQEIFFHPLNGTELGSHPFLTTRDRELVS